MAEADPKNSPTPIAEPSDIKVICRSFKPRFKVPDLFV